MPTAGEARREVRGRGWCPARSKPGAVPKRGSARRSTTRKSVGVRVRSHPYEGRQLCNWVTTKVERFSCGTASIFVHTLGANVASCKTLPDGVESPRVAQCDENCSRFRNDFTSLVIVPKGVLWWEQTMFSRAFSRTTSRRACSGLAPRQLQRPAQWGPDAPSRELNVEIFRERSSSTLAARVQLLQSNWWHESSKYKSRMT